MESMEAEPQDPKPPSKLDAVKLSALGAVLVAVISVTAIAVSPDDPPTKLDENGIAIVDPGVDAGVAEQDAGPATKEIDVAKYNREIKTYRKLHPGAVDLLSPPVEPGESVTVGVNVELGKRATDVQPVGGSWKITGTTATDRESATWIEVTAINVGSEAARFVAIVQVE